MEDRMKMIPGMNPECGSQPSIPFTYIDLLGKSFEYGGRGPDTFDCYGLCIELRRRAGLPMPDGYLSCRDFSEIDSRLSDGTSRFAIELPSPRPFCLATFRLHPRYTSHIGFVLGDSLHFVHIMQKMRVTVERLDAFEWRNKITGFFEVNPHAE
jgi:murein DD-endopeptidase